MQVFPSTHCAVLLVSLISLASLVSSYKHVQYGKRVVFPPSMMLQHFCLELYQIIVRCCQFTIQTAAVDFEIFDLVILFVVIGIMSESIKAVWQYLNHTSEML